MSVIQTFAIQTFIGEAADTKPTGVPAGSTYHETDTGEQFIFDGTNWIDDLRMIFAVSQAIE
ncbi:MAG: hypothetical protein D4R45_05065 [Planctomycetaceae bacterium]|nr:MAG: hypothetical protein D4R45_05065 [Planctomycetaceae bacterium]